MDICVVRHAIAAGRDAARWPDDSRRPLTEKGSISFRKAARGLRTIVPEVEVLLASSYTRAWQTAMLLHEEAGWPAPEHCRALEGSEPLANVLEELQERRERDSIALVGHEPQLSLLVSLLVSGIDGALRLELKKGAASLVSFQGEPAHGQGVLRWSVSPRILRGLAVAS